jgi:hypothetical protein
MSWLQDLGVVAAALSALPNTHSWSGSLRYNCTARSWSREKLQEEAAARVRQRSHGLAPERAASEESLRAAIIGTRTGVTAILAIPLDLEARMTTFWNAPETVESDDVAALARRVQAHAARPLGQ